MTMRAHRRRFAPIARVLALCVMVCSLVPAIAAEHTVARVTDLNGTAELLDNAPAQKLRMLARVRAGNRISLAPGGSLTLHFPGNRTDFSFQGPDTILVEDQRAVSETSAAQTRTHGDIGVELNLADTDLGAIAMRSLKALPPPLKILGPADTRVLMAKPVTFRWNALTGSGPFNVVLQDESGLTLFSQTTTTSSLILPPGIRLQPGRNYRWEVSTVAPDGTRESASAVFSTAPAEAEARYYRLAGLANGAVSDRVLYALYLEEMMLHEEAGEMWRHLETLRPGIRAEHGLQQ